MGVLKKVFGGGNPVAGVVVETAEGVANIVERWAPSEDKKHQMYLDINNLVQSNAEAARKYDPRSGGSSLFMEITNGLVDAVARLIRPGVTILLVGAVFGWWPVKTESLDPVVLGWSEAVMVFWFGARTLFKDIPSLIKAIQNSRK